MRATVSTRMAVEQALRGCWKAAGAYVGLGGAYGPRCSTTVVCSPNAELANHLVLVDEGQHASLAGCRPGITGPHGTPTIEPHPLDPELCQADEHGNKITVPASSSPTMPSCVTQCGVQPLVHDTECCLRTAVYAYQQWSHHTALSRLVSR